MGSAVEGLGWKWDRLHPRAYSSSNSRLGCAVSTQAPPATCAPGAAACCAQNMPCGASHVPRPFAASRRCAECSEVAVSHRRARRTGGLGLGRLGCLARVVASRTAMSSATVCRPYDGDSCGRHACSSTHVFSAVIRRGSPILICGLPRFPSIASRPSLRSWYQSLIAHPAASAVGSTQQQIHLGIPCVARVRRSPCSSDLATSKFGFSAPSVFPVPLGLNTGDLTGKFRT